MPHLILTQHDGTRYGWGPIKSEISDAAYSLSNPGVPEGFLGAVDISPLAQPFVLPKHLSIPTVAPDGTVGVITRAAASTAAPAAPIGAPAPTLTTSDIFRHNALVDTAIANHNALKAAILACLTSASRDALRDPDTGHSKLSIRQILLYMDAQYGHITDVDVAAVIAKLDNVFVDGCVGGLAGHITDFRNRVKWIDKYSEPIAPGRLYGHFRDSLVQCGLFSVQQQMWNTMPGHQQSKLCRLEPTGTDEGYFAYVLAAYDGFAPRATTGTSHYASAATAPPAAAASGSTVAGATTGTSNGTPAAAAIPMDQMFALFTAFTASQAAAQAPPSRNQRTRGTRTTNATTPAAPRGQPGNGGAAPRGQSKYIWYCWTCGTRCDHGYGALKPDGSPFSCPRPAPGHRDDATVQNRLGGK